MLDGMFDGMLHEIAEATPERSARGIAGAISRLVTHGRFAPGTQMPPVRRVAAALACSPTTVNEAWQILARNGVLDARGRSGTFVRSTLRASAGPSRYRRVTPRASGFHIDLSTGTPDAALLPNLRRALSFIERDNLTSSYLDEPVLPELNDAIRGVLPFDPESLTVVDGALDALDRIATQHVRHGDRVAVEACTFPPVLDLLALLGAELVPVDGDHDGLLPESLANALRFSPTVLFTQPRAHNPLGSSTPSGRMAELAEVLKGHDTVVVEDDHSGAISVAPDVSLSTWCPERVLHITSFSKSHGPDLRLASVAGPSALVDPLAERRTLGPGWSSRILQAVLASLLTDRVAVGEVAAARDEYARRRRMLCAELAARDVAFSGSDGLNLWIDVDDERDAVVALASQGIAVSPGSPFVVAPDGRDHIRVTVGMVRDGQGELASRIAAAAVSHSRPGAR